MLTLIILSTFVILLLYLSNTFLFENIKQVWADSVIANITVGTSPQYIAYESNDSRMYVANYGIYPYNDGSISVIDTKTNTVEPTAIPVESHPDGVVYNPVDVRLYVVKELFDTVSSLFLYALKSQVSRIKYQRRLDKFFDFLELEGLTVEETIGIIQQSNINMY